MPRASAESSLANERHLQLGVGLFTDAQVDHPHACVREIRRKDEEEFVAVERVVLVGEAEAAVELRGDLADREGRGECGVDVARHPLSVVLKCHRGAADDEQLRLLATVFQAIGELLEEGAELLCVELAVSSHARAKVRPVMRIPRSRKARGLSCSASSRKMLGTSGYHDAIRRSGSPAHAGISHPSRSARWSARAAKAASSSLAAVGAGTSEKPANPRATPPRLTVEE
ncbi:hypothetical protein [Rathayibacter tritici]|uniref:hypothetical protein n=1 Tax=Rathayibacter tritici TaxID=33888 RepID=UPI0015E21B13|nr:hypothetical protein [Rathayibacter tritici]